MSIEQHGTLDYTFEDLMANIAENTRLSLCGRTVEIVVAKTVEAELDFTYRPGISGQLSGPPEDCYPAEPAEVRFHSIKAKSDFVFAGLHMDLLVRAGFDLMEFLSESEIEKLEEFIIKRAERR